MSLSILPFFTSDTVVCGRHSWVWHCDSIARFDLVTLGTAGMRTTLLNWLSYVEDTADLTTWDGWHHPWVPLGDLQDPAKSVCHSHVGDCHCSGSVYQTVFQVWLANMSVIAPESRSRCSACLCVEICSLYPNHLRLSSSRAFRRNVPGGDLPRRFACGQ